MTHKLYPGSAAHKGEVQGSRSEATNGKRQSAVSLLALSVFFALLHVVHGPLSIVLRTIVA